MRQRCPFRPSPQYAMQSWTSLAKGNLLMLTSPVWLWTAAVLCGATFLLHLIPGSKENVPPLLASDMKPQPKFTNYYCWHLVTITIFAMTVFFALAAHYPAAWELGLAATLIAGAFTLLSFAVIAKSGLKPWLLPQWLFFAPICVAGAVAFI